MNAYELNERREALREEAAFLQAEQGSSQSPTRSRAISSRLSEITAELFHSKGVNWLAPLLLEQS